MGSLCATSKNGKKFKFKGMRLSRTFDCYDYSDSLLYSDLHDVLKYYKHGYSKVTDHVSREIRFLSGLLKNLEEKSLIIFHHKTLLMLKYFL